MSAGEFQQELRVISARAPWQGTATARLWSTEDCPGKRLDFREFYRSHFDSVLRTLHRLGVREVDALDLAQKVFWVAYLKLPEFEYRSSLSRWLFRIAFNVASVYRRSAPIRREVATDLGELDQLMGAHDELRERDEKPNRLAIAESLLKRLARNPHLQTRQK